jgi:bifunctional DNA-binding transcriptional regulator/antitoxin component of YhaV-PrlF toxin-antitoxin module
MPRTTVSVTSNEVETDDGDTRTVEQARTTVPKQIREFFDLEQGDEFDWGMGSSSNKIELEIIRGGDSGESR